MSQYSKELSERAKNLTEAVRARLPEKFSIPVTRRHIKDMGTLKRGARIDTILALCDSADLTMVIVNKDGRVLKIG